MTAGFAVVRFRKKYRIKDSVTGREQKLPLYHKGVDGMCRMLEEGIIDEKEFFEIFWETPYETLKENRKVYRILSFTTGLHCIG